MLKKFFIQLVSNPDSSFSTKRTMGWISMICTIICGFIGILGTNINEVIFATVFGGFITAWLTIMGITSYDNKQYYQKITGNKGENSPAPGI